MTDLFSDTSFNKGNGVDTLFGVGQIRLAELSVFNWGSFNGLHTATIDPMGTLVTGDNGAGKSTLIDGLMALLLPVGKASFNMAAAQGDRSDRSLLSYMRGSFGSAHDGVSTRVKSKRESAVVTGLRALYRGDDGACITLAALFWTTQSTNALADVNRVYMVAKREMALKEVLDAFGEGNARLLKQWLRDDPALTCCDNNFSVYQALYQKLLYMENRNAPALLSRALGLKKIDDLTDLIRELVLEPSSVKDDARKVVEEFADLVAIHDKLVDARKQENHLSRLPVLDKTLRQTRERLTTLTCEKEGLAAYFGEIAARLWRTRMADIERRMAELERQIRETETEEADNKALAERRHGEYLKFGGDRIESLKQEIEYTGDTLSRITRQSSEYQKTAKQLSLDTELVEATLLRNQSVANDELEKLDVSLKTADDAFVDQKIAFGQLKKDTEAIEKELEEIRARPDSNIPLRYQQLRDELVSALELDQDQLVFLAELLDVKEGEQQWQGAIERAMGGLRTTLAVPQTSYRLVTRWLNSRHTGLHVRVQVVNDSKATNAPAFLANGYLRKLEWRKHRYRDWLKAHLRRFDLQCVADTGQLDNTPFSMTQQGLIHKEKGRFEKKDLQGINDRRQWNLGFSNKTRLEQLAHDRNQLIEQLKAAGLAVADAQKALKALQEKETLWQALGKFQWDEINAPYWQKKLAALNNDLAALEKTGGDLDKARVRWESAKEALEACQQQLKTLSAQQGSLTTEHTTAKGQYEKTLRAAEQGVEHAVRERLAERVGELTVQHLADMQRLQQNIEGDLDKAINSAQNKKASTEREAVRIMSTFSANDKWQTITADWQSDVDSLPEFLGYLKQLKEEGLPELVDSFVERLNKHATQSLAQIKTRLESEREDILERINTINGVLKRTEFRHGSHLKLVSKKEKYPHVQDFEKQLRKVFSQATSDNHEDRYLQLKGVVEILKKASTTGTASNLESLRLLDSRYQMSFCAEEWDARTNKVLDVLESSSGKSGGEKESFAGTIVAASLAYVLTPEGYDKPVYSTVFLDEAFSNTAEAVSRRVLRVFRELHIHVNLITPYKNLNLARESARSLLIAQRDAQHHDSHLCEVTWEEIDKRMQASKTNDAHLYGIELASESEAGRNNV